MSSTTCWPAGMAPSGETGQRGREGALGSSPPRVPRPGHSVASRPVCVLSGPEDDKMSEPRPCPAGAPFAWAQGSGYV